MNFTKIIGGIISILAITLFFVINNQGYTGFIDFISTYSNYEDKEGIKAFFSSSRFNYFKYVLVGLTVFGITVFIFSNPLSRIGKKLATAIQNIFKDVVGAYRNLDAFGKGAFSTILLANIIIKVYYASTIPINHDEAMGYGLFASRGLLVSMSYYYTNNHILHHVLVNLCSWLPLDMVLKIRIPTLIANFLAIGGFFFVFNKHLGTKLAIILTTLFSFLFPILYYGYLSRGYSLVFFSFIIMFYAALGIISTTPKLKHFVALTIGGVIGLYAHPTFIYPAFAISSLLFFYVLYQKDIDLIKNLITAGIAMGVLIFLLYAPVLLFSGPDKLFGNAWTTQPITRMDVLHGLYPQFKSAYFLIFNNPHAILIVLPIIVAGVFAAKFSKASIFAILLILVNPLVLLLQSMLVFDRYWIFLVVPTLFLLGFLLKRVIPPNFSLNNKLTSIISIALMTFLVWNFNKRVQYEELFSVYSKTISDYLVSNNCNKLFVTHLHGVAIPRYYFIINDKKVELNHIPTDEDITPEEVKDYKYVLAKYELKSLEGPYKKVFDFKTDHRTWENAILYERVDTATSLK